MEITPDGTIPIPPAIQEQLGLFPGTEIEFLVVGNTLQLQKKPGPSRGQALIARMRGKATAKLSTDDIMQLTRVMHLLQTPALDLPAANPLDQPTEVLSTDLPLGVFVNDPYFEEIVQRLRAERELDTDNLAYT